MALSLSPTATSTFLGSDADGAFSPAAIEGTASNDTLIGTPDSDLILGHEGDDILDGLAGADRLIGGTGGDRYYVDDPGDQVIEAVGGGIDTVYAAGDYTLPGGQEIEFVRGDSVNSTSFGAMNSPTICWVVR